MSGKRDFGDYQTPLDFADKVCRFIHDRYSLKPSFVIEPSCGTGNFLQSSLIFDADEYFGIEINESYYRECLRKITDGRVRITNADFFQYNIDGLRHKSNILAIGNPPWVNNSTLAGKCNLPSKSNFKKMRGIEALTGASNFDISEYIVLRLINHLRENGLTVAMLLKTSAARRIFQELMRTKVRFSCFDMFTFGASKIFNVDVQACLMFIRINCKEDDCISSEGRIFSIENPDCIISTVKYENGYLINTLKTGAYDFRGHCSFEWHQGVKHDCSRVMELNLADGKTFMNGMNELTEIESEIIFPLVKSSMLKVPVINTFSKYVIITQKHIRQDTSYIEHKMPHAWKYLKKNIEAFNKRKSSVYRNMPPFSMFGVGDYSFSLYKVAVSGFYRKPMFSLLYSSDGKPVMTDDTIYFICFDSYYDAYTAMLILNTEYVQNFLMSAAFSDAKRIYTKKLLAITDFGKICKAIDFDAIKRTEAELELESCLDREMLAAFCTKL